MKFENWVNADFFVGWKPWRTYAVDWMIDLRYPLNCDNDVWDGVFREHTLEHLHPAHALALIKEIDRTLKPGGWFRVNVPNLKKYVDNYIGKTSDEKFHQWPSGCEAIHALTQNWGHLSVWDPGLLGRFLREAKFPHPKEVGFREGTDTRLLKDNPERRWETLYMEAQKA